MPDVRWRGLEHQTLYDWINTGPGSTASTPQLDYWGGLRQSLADISAKLSSTLGDLGATWEGLAGASATTGLTPLQLWAEEAQSSAEVMSSSAQDQADHVATARAAMPEPQQVPTAAPTMWQQQEAADAAQHGKKGPAQAVAQQAADHEAQETAAADAHERAVQVMSNYQANSENNAATLGVFGTPPDIVVAVELPNGTDSVTRGHAGLTPTAKPIPGAAELQQAGPGQVDGVRVDPAAAAATQGPAAMPAAAAAPAASASSVAPAAGLAGAAAAIGGAGALAGVSRPALLTGSGAMMGVGRGGRGENRTRAAASRPAQTTAPTISPQPREAGMPPPPPAGAGAGMGAGGQQEVVRGGNPYLSVNPTTGQSDGMRRAPGATTGAMAGIGQGGPEFGPNPGGSNGATGAPPSAPQQGGQFAHGAPPPMAGAGAGAGQAGGGQGYDEEYEGSTYLVETDSVFDDVRMVAPPVLGEND